METHNAVPNGLGHKTPNQYSVATTRDLHSSVINNSQYINRKYSVTRKYNNKTKRLICVLATKSERITELKEDTKPNIVARSDLYSSNVAEQITCFKKSIDPNVTQCNHVRTLATF